jgi:alpha-L-fucosidase 2
MKGGLISAATARLPARLLASKNQSANDVLWYNKPAGRWLEALPIGNGRIGAMIYGGLEIERIGLSESTVWSGAPETGAVNPEARSHLEEIRELLFQERYVEARTLCERYLLGKPKNFGTNLPLPELQVIFGGAEGVSNYRRSLDLDSAIAEVSYRQHGALAKREFFASHPDQILVARFTSEGEQPLNFSIRFGQAGFPCAASTEGSNTLLLRGDAFEKLHSTGHDGVRFEIRVQVSVEGGELTPAAEQLKVNGAKTATVLIAVATSFASQDPRELNAARLQTASRKPYAQLRDAHIEDHRALYRRTSIDLGESPAAHDMPTDLRRKALESGADDPALVALFFQYGRYLTIAGSRAGSPLPLALQGIWNDGLASSMGWTDDYHLDINTQQNYWAAEVCNLAECQLPLFGLIEIMRASGRTTAKEMYGAPGWVVHTVTNPWGYTAPGWGIGWGLYVTAGIWISLQLWEHYRFNPDTKFLRMQAYPVFREAAEFFLAYMVPEPTHGWLVTGPSDSPENWYKTPSGDHAAESMGNTCDRAFVYALYSICIEGSTALGIDEEFRSRVKAARDRLPPFQIGRHGQLQEWLHDFEDAEPNHRHTSHLLALYPLNQISPQCTPPLARAAEVTLQRRMSAPNWEQSEWGRANLVAYHARLLQGDAAHQALVGLIAKAADDSLLTFSSAGVAGADQNIFSLDGNTAGAAGMAEMLLQSQDGEIVILPALPSAWSDGSVRGLCARGGYEIDIRGRNSRLQSVSIRGRVQSTAHVRYQDAVRPVVLRPGQRVILSPADFQNASSIKKDKSCDAQEEY